MKSGIGTDHRRRMVLREELGLFPAASDDEVIEALMNKVKTLEGKLNLIEKALLPGDTVPKEWE